MFNRNIFHFDWISIRDSFVRKSRIMYCILIIFVTSCNPSKKSSCNLHKLKIMKWTHFLHKHSILYNKTPLDITILQSNIKREGISSNYLNRLNTVKSNFLLFVKDENTHYLITRHHIWNMTMLNLFDRSCTKIFI